MERPASIGESNTRSHNSNPANNYQDRPISENGAEKTSVGKKKKKKPAPVNIEEIFNQVSQVVASNINPPPGRMILTPRSAEVCLKFGINPEVLKIRDIDSFWEPDLDPAVQRMRHEAYVQRRHELMKQCRHERKRMINAEFKSATNLSPEAGLTPEMILEQQKQANSTLILMEQQRMEKIQKRQEKELEQMMQYEINRVKVQQDMEKRFQEAKKMDELRKKQQEKRFKLMAEERRLRELQKIAMEEADEETRKRAAIAMHEKDRQLAAEREQRLAEERARLAKEEAEKREKHEEHRKQLQQYFLEEQMKLRERLESMQQAEKKKQDALLQKQADCAAALRHKRAVVEKRISHNMQMAQAIEEKRKSDFLKKQEYHDKIREEHLRKQEEDRRLHAQEVELQEQRRQMVLLQQRRDEQQKAEHMLEKFDEEEIHVQEVVETRSKEMGLFKEKRSLRRQMKVENVERVMRVGEYKRLNTLKKIEDNDERIEKMLQQKQTLIRDRRHHAAEARLQKENITKVMEELRTNAAKANKIIAKAMTGAVSLSSLLSSSEKRPPRSKSSDGKRSRSPKTIESNKIGLGRGDDYNNSSLDGNSYFENGDGLREVFLATKEPEPKPYVSPYLSTGLTS